MSPFEEENPAISEDAAFEGFDAEGAVEPRKWRGSASTYRAIEKALTASNENVRRQRSPISRRGVVFTPARRELTLRRLGFPVVFYPREIHDTRNVNEKVYVYMDVSGSMLDESVMSFLFGLLIHLHEAIGDTLYQFTTRVRPVTMDQIRRGFVLSGGTDIEPVINHALQNRFERIVVISDGDFGGIKDSLLARARKAGLFVAFLITEEYPIDEDTASLGQAWHIHEELGELERENISADAGADETRSRAKRERAGDNREGDQKGRRPPNMPNPGC